MTVLQCMICGKRCSPEFQLQGFVLRGGVTCPECIEKERDQPDDRPSLLKIMKMEREIVKLKNELAEQNQVMGELCDKCGWATRLPVDKDNTVCFCELEKELDKVRQERDEVIKEANDYYQDMKRQRDNRFTLDEMKYSFKLWLFDGVKELTEDWDTGDEREFEKMVSYIKSKRKESGEPPEEQDMVECPECGGEGFVNVDDVAFIGKCVTCKGTGKVTCGGTRASPTANYIPTYTECPECFNSASSTHGDYFCKTCKGEGKIPRDVYDDRMEDAKSVKEEL